MIEQLIKILLFGACGSLVAAIGLHHILEGDSTFYIFLIFLGYQIFSFGWEE